MTDTPKPLTADEIGAYLFHVEKLGNAYSREMALRFKATLEQRDEQIEKLRKAATRWPRCCDLWQDRLGVMHCTECAQKTFAMMRDIQQIFGVDRGCEALAETEPKP